ncbi:MAG TPA: MATE family efflux transporter [Psychromonas hadalis]|nr:MATE family efflux transporter [Psychromonas hadalis]
MTVQQKKEESTKAKFLHGPILGHVLRMSATNAIGLSALFLVDLIDMFFISQLNDTGYTAAIGYASVLLFFGTSVSIAFIIVNSALVSKSIGQGDRVRAKQLVANISIYSVLLISLISIALWITAPFLLSAMGAKDKVLVEATQYLRIIVPATPIFAIAMQMGATLRSVGDAKHAMYTTVGGGLINAILDPILIFTFKMDLQGAAIASVVSRFTVLFIGLYYVHYQHKLLQKLDFSHFRSDFKQMSSIAFPAMLTQITTPLTNIYVTYEISQFGSNYVAGWVIVGRLIPVAFALVFAASGAIGPIIGQNYGAKQLSRVRETLLQTYKFVISYTLVVSLLLSLGQNYIIDAFNATHETAEFIRLFCHFIAPTFIFTGITFIVMAFLNNLGYAKYSTYLNLAKMLLGTFPFVTAGAFYYQAPGILYGQALRSIIFAIIGLLLANKILNNIEQENDSKGV